MKKTGFKVLENEWIPLADGRRLAARIWMPDSAARQPAPAILEYLPYRKRDATAPRDEINYPAFAAAGYVGLRVDIAGTGESDGSWDDEYSAGELADGCAVIEWIAAQAWCDGKVGMMGISWGGFNSLQIAALQPPALRAVISIGSSVDRYNDDIHYKNGCLLFSNFSWSSCMLCFAARPPDPDLVGESWRDTWLQRLDALPFPLQTWLANQRKNEYWARGSIADNYGSVQIPALLISGWGDGYVNAPSAAAANIVGAKAINGPWIHQYPHLAHPGPRLDFIGEAIDWWDKWLKGKDNGVERLPAYRAFILENHLPGPPSGPATGRWVAEPEWPSAEIQRRRYYLGPNRQLLDIPGRTREQSVSSPQDCGASSGDFFTQNPTGDLPADQRHDDSGSLVFDSGELYQPIEILGRPRISMRVAVDKPQANIIVRLNDIHPDGQVTRVSWGVLNLAHRKGNSEPRAMTPGRTEQVGIDLNECGYRFMRGHRMRVAISTSYWPMIMPPPETVTATLKLGPEAFIELPVRAGIDRLDLDELGADDPPIGEPPGDGALARRWVERNFETRESHYRIINDSGLIETAGHGMRQRLLHDDRWTIATYDPLSYRASSRYRCWMSRGDWEIRVETQCDFRCDADNFYIGARLAAFVGDDPIFENSWDELAIPRDHV